ncbi:hypothetical protein CR513_17017, partial [Mucuna pruriens]
MVKEMAYINHPNQLCEACLLGKHARRSFLKEATSRENEPFQLVHTNMCGPIDPLSFESWKGVKAKVDHLRVFGSIAYAYVPNQERSKLDDRSVKHLYNPNNGKIIVSKDVEFDETYFKEGDQEAIVPNEFSTSLLPPTPSIHEASSFEESLSERVRKMRSVETSHGEEIKAIKKNDTYELSNLPKSHEAIRAKAKGEGLEVEEGVVWPKASTKGNSHIDKYFQYNEFICCQHGYALYFKKFDNGDILIVCINVDDLNFLKITQICLKTSKRLCLVNLR